MKNNEKKTYLKRLCDAELNLALQSSGAILIEGAKWCGKTSTAENAAARYRSHFSLHDATNEFI
jgi:hypothetical protein